VITPPQGRSQRPPRVRHPPPVGQAAGPASPGTLAKRVALPDLPLLGQGGQITVQFPRRRPGGAPAGSPGVAERGLIRWGQAGSRGAQFRRHEVVQPAADGGLRPGHRQDVLSQPSGQHRPRPPANVIGLGPRPCLAERSFWARALLLPAPFAARRRLVFRSSLVQVSIRLVGAVLQVTDQRPELVQGMGKTSPRQATPGQGLLMAGAEAPRRKSAMVASGARPAGRPARAGRNPPGVGVAMLFLAQQGSSRWTRVSTADEDRATGLEDLVIGPRCGPGTSPGAR